MAAGRTSVPQIWINQEHVGGCDDLKVQYMILPITCVASRSAEQPVVLFDDLQVQAAILVVERRQGTTHLNVCRTR